LTDSVAFFILNIMVKYSDADLAFKALAHPVRRGMVERLAQQGELSVTDIASPFRISLPAALKHARLLEEGGLIHLTKRGRVQYCAIDVHSFDRITQWAQTQRTFWETSFSRLLRLVER